MKNYEGYTGLRISQQMGEILDNRDWAQLIELIKNNPRGSHGYRRIQFGIDTTLQGWDGTRRGAAARAGLANNFPNLEIAKPDFRTSGPLNSSVSDADIYFKDKNPEPKTLATGLVMSGRLELFGHLCDRYPLELAAINAGLDEGLLQLFANDNRTFVSRFSTIASEDHSGYLSHVAPQMLSASLQRGQTDADNGASADGERLMRALSKSNRLARKVQSLLSQTAFIGQRHELRLGHRPLVEEPRPPGSGLLRFVGMTRRAAVARASAYEAL